MTYLLIFHKLFVWMVCCRYDALSNWLHFQSFDGVSSTGGYQSHNK